MTDRRRDGGERRQNYQEPRSDRQSRPSGRSGTRENYYGAQNGYRGGPEYRNGQDGYQGQPGYGNAQGDYYGAQNGYQGGSEYGNAQGGYYGAQNGYQVWKRSERLSGTAGIRQCAGRLLRHAGILSGAAERKKKKEDDILDRYISDEQLEYDELYYCRDCSDVGMMIRNKNCFSSINCSDTIKSVLENWLSCFADSWI